MLSKSIRFACSTPARFVGSILWSGYLLPTAWVCAYQLLSWLENTYREFVGGGFFGWQALSEFMPPEISLPFLGEIRDNRPKAWFVLVLLILMWLGAVRIFSRSAAHERERNS